MSVGAGGSMMWGHCWRGTDVDREAASSDQKEGRGRGAMSHRFPAALLSAWMHPLAVKKAMKSKEHNTGLCYVHIMYLWSVLSDVSLMGMEFDIMATAPPPSDQMHQSALHRQRQTSSGLDGSLFSDVRSGSGSTSTRSTQPRVEMGICLHSRTNICICCISPLLNSGLSIDIYVNISRALRLCKELWQERQPLSPVVPTATLFGSALGVWRLPLLVQWCVGSHNATFT